VQANRPRQGETCHGREDNSSIIVLFGAELTYAYTQFYGHKAAPDRYSEKTEPELIEQHV
jgi:hypothetical protein